MAKYKKNIVEQGNDALMFWQWIGGHVAYIIGCIIILGLVIGGIIINNSIKARKEAAEQQATHEARVSVIENFIQQNNDVIGSVKDRWYNDNLYYIQNETGIYEIRFVGTNIFKITFTNNSGQSIIIYE